MACYGLPRWLNGKRICLLIQETQVWSLEEETATHSSLKNSMDRGTWLATIHGVAKGQTWLSTRTVLYWGAEFQPLMCSMCLVAQSYLTLCDLMDCSPPGSSVHWIFQARILEWAVISSSRAFSRPRDWAHVSCVFYTERWIVYCFANYTSINIF